MPPRKKAKTNDSDDSDEEWTPSSARTAGKRKSTSRSSTGRTSVGSKGTPTTSKRKKAKAPPAPPAPWTIITKKRKSKRDYTPAPPAAPRLFGCHDIVSEITSYLGRDDLHHCLTISKAFYQAAIPRLYRRFDVAGPVMNAAAPSSVSINPGRGPNAGAIQAFTTTLHLTPHNHTCSSYKVDLTRLRTVVVDLDKACSCVPTIPPQIRIVIPPKHSLCDPRKYPNQISCCVSATARDQVIYLHRLRDPYRYYPTLKWVPGDKQPTSDSTDDDGRLTIVLLPFFWDYGLVTRRPLPFRTTAGTSAFEQAVIGFVAVLASKMTQWTITVVGLEDANPFAPDSHFESRNYRQKTIADTLDREVDRKRSLVWPNSKNKNNGRPVKTKTLFEYLEGRDWKDELDWQLVGRYLNAYDSKVKEERRKEEAKKAKRS